MKHTIKFSDTSDLYDYLAENFPNLKFDSKYSQSETLRRFTCDGISLITYFNQYLVIYLQGGGVMKFNINEVIFIVVLGITSVIDTIFNVLTFLRG